MKVRDLMKELIDMDPDIEIRILISPFSTPDGKQYFADIDNAIIDYGSEYNVYDIFLSAMDFKNDEGGTLVDLLRQCKTIGDGVTEFPEYLRSYDESRKPELTSDKQQVITESESEN